jgi:hypothetical protein
MNARAYDMLTHAQNTEAALERPGHIMILEAAGTFPLSPEKLSTLDWCELQAWRRIGGRLQLAVENALRDAPDGAPAELISLQHDLVELRRAPFGGLPLTAIKQTFP